MYPQTRKGKRLRIFVGEATLWQGKPLYQVILERAQHHNMLLVTLTRGIEGFGPQHHLSTERQPDLADNLPMIVDILDEEARVDAFAPQLKALVLQGMVTVTSLDIVWGGDVRASEQ